MDAILTNIITNAFHAGFLFIYFIFALYYWQKKINNFTGLIVVFFLLIFLLKVGGVFAHYYHDSSINNMIWYAIACGVFCLSVVTAFAIEFNLLMKFIIVLVTFVFIVGFIIKLNFIFIAIPIMFIYAVSAFLTLGYARTGFILVVLSNIFWIVAREITQYYLGKTLPVNFRYDNDVYHLLLIISTYLIFLGVKKGQWSSVT